jgi:hypothetical protein
MTQPRYELRSEPSGVSSSTRRAEARWEDDPYRYAAEALAEKEAALRKVLEEELARLTSERS